jgi:hypothetical protein
MPWTELQLALTPPFMESIAQVASLQLQQVSYKDPTDPGKWFDAVAPVAIDAASIALAVKAQPKWKLQQQIGKDGAKYAIKLSDEMKELHRSGKVPAGTEHMMSAAVDTEAGAFAVGHNQNVRQMLNEPLSRVDPVPPGQPKPNFSCAEYQAIQRARDAGLNPDTVITIKKVDGGTAPAYTCRSCHDVTTHGMNVPTDNIPRTVQTQSTIPTQLGTTVGEVGAPAFGQVGTAAASAAGRDADSDEDDESDEHED